MVSYQSMSEFKFACPVCGQHITADSANSGGQLECPTCFRKIVVPQAPEAADPKFILAAFRRLLAPEGRCYCRPLRGLDGFFRLSSHGLRRGLTRTFHDGRAGSPLPAAVCPPTLAFCPARRAAPVAPERRFGAPRRRKDCAPYLRRLLAFRAVHEISRLKSGAPPGLNRPPRRTEQSMVETKVSGDCRICRQARQ